MKNRFFYTSLIPLAGLYATGCQTNNTASDAADKSSPNILFVIADDHSYPYAGAYGCSMVSTPGFDRVARQGALFSNAYVTSPGSSPSRASILTGLYPWQIEEAGTHASSFPKEYICFPDIFQKAGYKIGFTGKGWGPGNWKISERTHNPAGPAYNECKLEPPYSGISKIDYTANFKKFLAEREEGQPFCFWLGANEPHRGFEKDSWKKEGYELTQAEVPEFLPDANVIRGDILDYAVEVEWFDKHLSACLDELERIGELDNTIVIVTADNGMAFPHAKANCYDAGLHVPLAICWGDKIKQGKEINALVSMVSIAPTIFEAAGIEFKEEYSLSGSSLMPLLNGEPEEYDVDAVYAGRERHSSSRYNNWGYPIRSIRRGNYLLVRNFHSERWPAGDPQAYDKENGTLQPMHKAYYDIDGAPSKNFLINQRDQPNVKPYFDAAVAKRPEYELFDLNNDPECMHNLANNTSYAGILDRMSKQLEERLTETGDTRVVGDNPEIWESYPRLDGAIRSFPKED